MKWIVLSDLHMNFKNCTTNIARKKLLETLKLEREKSAISFVLIAGDCFNQNVGSPTELSTFIKKIANACKVKLDRVILCPGNHDVDRNNITRNKLISEYRQNGTLPKIDDCLAGHTNFKELYALLYRRPYKPFSIKNVEDCSIIAIDSSLLSMDGNDYGNLSVDFAERTDLNVESGNRFRIVVMHHGVEWLNAESGRRFQHWLSDNHVDMVFCGHNHAPGMNILTEAIGEEGVPRDGIPQFTCGCALSDSYANPIFMVGEFVKDLSFEIKLYEYKNNSRWQISDGLLRSFDSGIYQESGGGLIKNCYDIPKRYETIFDIGDDVAQELKKSGFLYFFGLRGHTFLREKSKISDALHASYESETPIDCRLLVSNPYNHNIDKRLRNIPEYAFQSDLERQWKTIYEDIKNLRDESSHFPLQSIRFHEQPLLFRFILTEESVYFGYYSKEASSKTRMYRYDKASAFYKSLKDYFKTLWESSDANFSSTVPDRCSFVLDKFGIKPSLVINLTSSCNMNCRYCPDGGENLKECDELCDLNQIEYLLTSYAQYYLGKGWKEKKVVRITGGEPLMYQERIVRVLKQARREGYEKIVLCTNGVLLEESYNQAQDVWESVKNILLLKISLDSIHEDVFSKLTGTDYYEIVIRNIEFAKRKGFTIELNLVATKDNAKEIEEVYDYAYRLNLFGVKVLTINDFGERVEQEDVTSELNQLIERMREKHYIETGLYVHNNKGIHMKRFIHDSCSLTIVDHINAEKSVTPRRTYSVECQSCKYYPESLEVRIGRCRPCATGIMSLTMRADGLLSFCRMQGNTGTYLSGCDLKEVYKMVESELSKFEKCYHYQIGG